MTKSELIKRVAKYCPQGGKDAEVVVQTILEILAESDECDNHNRNIVIGVFNIKERFQKIFKRARSHFAKSQIYWGKNGEGAKLIQ